MSSGNSLKLGSLATEKLRAIFKQSAAPYASAQAFHHLYETTHIALFRFIYALYNGPIEDVEDLTADTYERAWKARKGFSGNADAAMGWLLAIARNVTIDRRRKWGRTPSLQSLDNVDQIDGALVNVEQAVIGQEQQALILSALDVLSMRDREILILRYLLG